MARRSHPAPSRQTVDGWQEKWRVAEAIVGSAQTGAFPQAFSDLMRACQIAAELPPECAGVTPMALASQMKASAKIGMVQNAPCPVDNAALDEMASLMLALG